MPKKKINDTENDTKKLAEEAKTMLAEVNDLKKILKTLHSAENDTKKLAEEARVALTAMKASLAGAQQVQEHCGQMLHEISAISLECAALWGECSRLQAGAVSESNRATADLKWTQARLAVTEAINRSRKVAKKWAELWQFSNDRPEVNFDGDADDDSSEEDEADI